MSISIIAENGDMIDVLDDGVKKTIRRSILNREFVRLIGTNGSTLGLANNVYNAFPDFQVISGSLVGIYSSGIGHGNSQRQIMVRSDDGGLNWDSVVFFEAATLEYDFSLLTDIMVEGQVNVFKVWSVERTASDFNVYINSTVENAGVNYAIWSQPKEIDGALYRTGYGVNNGRSESALLKSTDNGITWTFQTVVFADPSYNFSESAITKMPDGRWYAVCRQDGENSRRPMWQSFSSDGGVTWTPPQLIGYLVINGTQPDLITIGSDVFLMTGDRTGFSGLDSAGNPSYQLDVTGISIWKSSDNANSWTRRINTELFWSTDGGQPKMVYHGGLIKYMFYGAPGATNTMSGREPGVYYREINPDNIV